MSKGRQVGQQFLDAVMRIDVSGLGRLLASGTVELTALVVEAPSGTHYPDEVRYEIKLSGKVIPQMHEDKMVFWIPQKNKEASVGELLSLWEGMDGKADLRDELAAVTESKRALYVEFCELRDKFVALAKDADNNTKELERLRKRVVEFTSE